MIESIVRFTFIKGTCFICPLSKAFEKTLSHKKRPSLFLAFKNAQSPVSAAAGPDFVFLSTCASSCPAIAAPSLYYWIILSDKRHFASPLRVTVTRTGNISWRNHELYTDPHAPIQTIANP